MNQPQASGLVPLLPAPPQNGQPPYAQPLYVPPPYAQPQFGQPRYSQPPQYVMPPHVAPQYFMHQQPQLAQQQNAQAQPQSIQTGVAPAAALQQPLQKPQPQPEETQRQCRNPVELEYMDDVKDVEIKYGNTASFRKVGYYHALETGVHSDVIVRDRDGAEWKVHKLIVTKTCEFFKNALSGSFRESRRNVVEMPNDDPAAVKALLEYLYVEDYSIVEDTPRKPEVLLQHLEVYIIGQIYVIPGLQDLAYRRFVKYWFTAWCPCPIFNDVARRVYNSTLVSDKQIRCFIADMAAVHLRGLLLNREFVEVMADFEAFSIDIAKSMVKNDDKCGTERARCKSQPLHHMKLRSWN
ncbi:hypothetical protein HDK64DRAFT_255878 [Phyllosticta capitalensis]|uniref:BTB domain-containing protein n=1 Tax=Phyllosticta capitalensis TaxID=121624 RepID=A0ABR1YK71_9PEZI